MGNVSIIETKANFIHISVQTPRGFFQLIVVYGPTSTTGKKAVWDSIAQIIFSFPLDPLIIGGDFNAIMSSQDKTGGIIPPPKSMQDFNNFVTNFAIKDCIPINGSFTWTNRRKEFTHIAECLDSFFVNPN